MIEITGDYAIPFKWAEGLGRPEFAVCARFVRGRFTDLWITRQQQQEPFPDDWQFHVRIEEGRTGWSVGSWDGLEEPRPWMFGWCKDHRAHLTRIYVPTGSKYLFVHLLSTISLHFTKKS